MRHLRSLLYLFGLLLSTSLQAAPHTRIDLLSETLDIQPGKPLLVALRLQMDPKWHTYWINPGESGFPTEIKWKLPAGFSAGPIQWPYPQRITMGPVTTFGFEKEALLFIQIQTPAAISDNSVTLKAHVDWLECEIECIPGKDDVSLTLPVTHDMPQPNPDTAPLFAEHQARLPLEKSPWTISALSTPLGYRLVLEAPAGADPVGAIDFFPDQRDMIRESILPKVRRSGSTITIDVERSENAPEPARKISGVIVSEKGWRGPGSERALTVNASVTGMITPGEEEPGDPASPSLPLALVLAFAGGLLLNLMPCVLPILSIKVLGFVQTSHGDARGALRQGLLFSAGVVVSFWVLAGGLLALQAGGAQLGWGFQLQSPPFVLFLASLFFLLGLSLAGVFEIGTSFIGVAGNGSTGSFMSGVLATLVATPCTAPFMGSALGYALAQPPMVAFSVFTMLAVGMALPYVVLSAHPAFLRFVPKPGPWMDTFKQALGFLLIGTVVWLAWVLSLQTGPDGVGITLSVLFLQGLGAWIWGRWVSPLRSTAVRRTATIIALLLMGGSYIGALSLIRSEPPATTKTELSGWEPYSKERVQELRNGGQAVFVDFTAAWCLTCQVNKRVALHTDRVSDAFRQSNVATLRADWTSRDPRITEALREFGRSGVPVYALFPANPVEPPQLLPEVLTPDIVIDALNQLKTKERSGS